MGEETKKIDKPTVRISREHHDALKALAEERDMAVTEVLEEMIGQRLLSKPTEEATEDSILDAPTKQDLTEWANERNMTPTAAARKLITVAIGRLRALSTYGNKFRKRD